MSVDALKPSEALEGVAGSSRSMQHNGTDIDNTNNIEYNDDIDPAPTPIMINKKGDRVVRRLKCLVLACLICSTVGIAVAVYFYSNRLDQSEFQERYSDAAQKVLEALGGNLLLSLDAVDSMVISMVSFARFTNQSWPYVTIPDFELRASKIRIISKAVFVSIVPLVTNRTAWDSYTNENNQWINESIAIQNYKNGNVATTSTETWDIIYDYRDYENKKSAALEANSSLGKNGLYMPTWQCSPVIPSTFPVYNFDFMPIDNTTIDTVLKSNQVVISNAALVEDEQEDDEHDNGMDMYTQWISQYVGADENPVEPLSVVFYPIMDTAYIDSGKIRQDEVFGFLTLHIYWRDLLKNLLPISDGIDIVVENPCNPTFTYRIVGSDVVYIGPGDQHEKSYDELEYSSLLQDLLVSSLGNEDHPDDTLVRVIRPYVGLPVNEEFCQFNIRVYPSALFQEQFDSLNPFFLTVAAILICALTSFVFFIYDCLVERRQQSVMSTAVQSTLNVTLLEQKVRERTIRLENTNKSLEEANRKVTNASALQLQHFASMSHEIRTPLNCIIGLSSLLEQEQNLDPTQQEWMRMIVTSGELLRAIVDDVLDYSKLESGNVDIEIKKSNLQETVTTVVHSVDSKSLTMSKNIKIKTFYDLALSEYVNTDRRRLQQILYNLLGNAIKFSKEGGVVELSVCIASSNNNYDDNIDVSRRSMTNSVDLNSSSSLVVSTAFTTQEAGVAADNNNIIDQSTSGKILRFAVKDYGKGISKDNFDIIFQPFLQAGEGEEIGTVYGGTGLGLAITKKLVQGLGGSISVDSEVGKWTTFTVDFPLLDPPVDVKKLSDRLKETTVFLLISNSTENNKEVIAQVTDIFTQYKVDFHIFSGMNELLQAQASILSAKNDGGNGALHRSCNRTYVCLSNEDLVDIKAYGQALTVSSSFNKPMILLTFGPKNNVTVCEGHYRSLDKMFPSVLIKSLGDYVADEASNNRSSRWNLATPSPFDGGSSKQMQQQQQNYPGNNIKSGSSNNTNPIASAGPGKRRKSDIDFSPAKIPVPYGDLRILVAEDNLVNQKVVLRILNRLGVPSQHVDIVDNGKKAVELEATKKFDVVLLDMQMPVMDGIEACKRITKRISSSSPLQESKSEGSDDKRNDGNETKGNNLTGDGHHQPITKVIFLTAQVSNSFENECFQAGAVGFLAKPCTLKSFEECFQKLL